MRLTLEAAKIRNLGTQETTVIDDEGNIADGIGGEPGAETDPTFDFFSDPANDQPMGGPDGLGVNGESDGLDAFFNGGGLEDELSLDEPEFDDVGGLDAGLEGGAGLDADLEGEGELGGLEGEEGLESEEGLLGDEEGEQDPDYQGVIRTVTGANLIYKRRTEDGVYEELWVYNVGKSMKTEAKIRRAILAGTDIGPQQISSEDGSQTIETSSIGNVQFLKIVGLPN